VSRYRNLALPALLVVAGIVALLANLNIIQWGSLYRLLDLWPVVLVLVGIELMLRASVPRQIASALGIAAVVVAVAAGLAYVAVGPPVPVGQRSLDASGPVSGVTKANLDLSFGAAQLNVHGADLGETLYRVHVDYAGNKPQVSFDAASATLTVQDSNQGFRPFFAPGGRRHADVTLDQALPWAVNLSGGASRATLDLSGVRLSGLDVSGGADSVTATLGRPAGTVTINISGGASSVTIRRPAGVPVSIHASGGANSIRLDGQHRSSLGDLDVATGGYDTATDRYEIDVSGGASNVDVGTTG